MTVSNVKSVITLGLPMELHFQKIKRGQRMECIIVIFDAKEKQKGNVLHCILMKTFSVLPLVNWVQTSSVKHIKHCTFPPMNSKRSVHTIPLPLVILRSTNDIPSI